MNGNGRNDVIIIGGRDGDVNLFWYENPLWTRYIMASVPLLEAGGLVLDITGNGWLDVVAGQQISGNELYWFECPSDPRDRWPKHVIEDRFVKYHDQAAGDLDDDGEPEIVVLSQVSGLLVYYDLPPDPHIAPWPREYCHLIADGMGDVEGLALVDIDGEGRQEIIGGPNICRPSVTPDEPWRVEPFAPHFVKTRIAVADLDGDGRLEIVLCEGESHPGRLAWCAPPDWTPHILRDDLFHPDSLQIADVNGDGLPDISVAEKGLGPNPDPKMVICFNQGRGRFAEVIFERGVPTHEAKLGDLTGDGRPDIVGRPYEPQRHIDVWFNGT